LLNAAETQGMRLDRLWNFQSHTGQGITGEIDSHRIALGNDTLMRHLKLDIDSLHAQIEPLRRAGQTVLFLAVGSQIVGLLGVADPVKTHAREAIEALQRQGVRVMMLTGDNRVTAEAVAQQLGLDEVEAGLLPEEKGQVIQRLQHEGRRVGMAGDGVNDAPALALAHVGIAMGTGTDIAMESADITLVQGDLRNLAKARKLSQGVMRNIRENLFFAFAYNSLGIPIAAGILYPFTGLLLNPMLAALAMSLSSVSVIANALRLRNMRL
jgi:Cu+-exporting ATPase